MILRIDHVFVLIKIAPDRDFDVPEPSNCQFTGHVESDLSAFLDNEIELLFDTLELEKSSMFGRFIAVAGFVLICAGSQAFADGVQLDDSIGASKLIDEMVLKWKFEDAFRLGDEASYYAKNCRDVSGKWQCSLQPFSLAVTALDSSQATLERKFEGAPSTTFVVTRQDFEDSKNFLSWFFANMECRRIDPKTGTEGPCMAKLTSMDPVSDRLSDGKDYAGFNIEFILNDNMKGSMYIGDTEVPWVARTALMRFPGEVFPESILLGYSREQ